jgi:uncharacterized protein YjiS (DUF1127 family)
MKGNWTMSTHRHATDAPFPFTGSAQSRVVDHQACIAVAHTMRALAFMRLMAAAAGFVRHRVVEPIKRWHERRQMQTALMALDDHMLADIGINRWEIPGVVSDAVREAAKAGASPVTARDVSGAVSEGSPANDETRNLAA